MTRHPFDLENAEASSDAEAALTSRRSFFMTVAGMAAGLVMAGSVTASAETPSKKFERPISDLLKKIPLTRACYETGCGPPKPAKLTKDSPAT